MVHVERTSDKSGFITSLHRYPDPTINVFNRIESIRRKIDLAPNDRNPKEVAILFQRNFGNLMLKIGA